MIPLAIITLAEGMLAAGCTMLTFLLLKRSYRMGRRPKGSQPLVLQSRPTSKWDGAQRDALAVVERQKVEMHDMARELTGQLATKIVVLEKLISDSQRQIDRMEVLVEELVEELGEKEAVGGRQ